MQSTKEGTKEQKGTIFLIYCFLYLENLHETTDFEDKNIELYSVYFMNYLCLLRKAKKTIKHTNNIGSNSSNYGSASSGSGSSASSSDSESDSSSSDGDNKDSKSASSSSESSDSNSGNESDHSTKNTNGILVEVGASN